MVLTTTAAEAATMNYVGVWSNNATYGVDNVVICGNQAFYALATSLNSVSSPTNPAWKLIATNGNAVGGGTISVEAFTDTMNQRLDGFGLAGEADRLDEAKAAFRAAFHWLLHWASMAELQKYCN